MLDLVEEIGHDILYEVNPGHQETSTKWMDFLTHLPAHPQDEDQESPELQPEQQQPSLSDQAQQERQQSSPSAQNEQNPEQRFSCVDHFSLDFQDW